MGFPHLPQVILSLALPQTLIEHFAQVYFGLGGVLALGSSIST